MQNFLKNTVWVQEKKQKLTKTKNSFKYFPMSQVHQQTVVTTVSGPVRVNFKTCKVSP